MSSEVYLPGCATNLAIETLVVAFGSPTLDDTNEKVSLLVGTIGYVDVLPCLKYLV